MSTQSMCMRMLTLLTLQAIPLTVSAATLKVPLVYPTIQTAINAANTGDVVQVSPGIYFENINFDGKAITVEALRGARPAIIDGGKTGPVVTFSSGEGAKSILSGFVIQDGLYATDIPLACDSGGSGGGGICIDGSSPTIEFNIIQNNSACYGAGIAVYNGLPVITQNVIQGNSQAECGGGIGGGGIGILGSGGGGHISNNVIENNTMDGPPGAGISSDSGGLLTITDNIIKGNWTVGDSPCSWGGGISVVNGSNVATVIVQNQIDGNDASCGAGIFMSVSGVSRGPNVVANTIADNTSGSAVYADLTNTKILLINNIIFGGTGQAALYCTDAIASVKSNDVYTSGASAYGGACANQTGTNGNISADPTFISDSIQDYQLQTGSPVIGAGSVTAPSLPSVDFAGATRIQNGTIDMGIFEYSAAQAAARTAAVRALNPGDSQSARAAHAKQGQRHGPFVEIGPGNRIIFNTYDKSGKLVYQTDANGDIHRMK